MSFQDYKRDDRPQRGRWAPGNYCCTCCDCGGKFIGDKRALECADCAYAPPKPPQHADHVVTWLWWHFNKGTGPFGPKPSI